MTTPDGRFTIVFNGEIYNYRELSDLLTKKGVMLRGRSDTEVLLMLFAERGETCLNLIDGMFAFAVWDSRERSLFCVRDQLGEKPLYYVSTSSLFAFSSEVRPLVRSGVVSGSPSVKGIGYLLSQGSIPPPYTHVQGISFLEPASWLRVEAGVGVVARQRYWRIPFVPEAEASQDASEAMEAVHHVLRRSVRRRLRADVPVGAFLSGGIDSSLVVALMQEQGAKNVRTFTVTLPGHRGDEMDRARSTAQLLGTDHHEIPFDCQSDTSWLEDALGDMDVPSIDGPNVWLVSRAVRALGIKVACSGLGADELFFGYPSFSVVSNFARLRLDSVVSHVPMAVRHAAAGMIPRVPRWSRLAEAVLCGASVAALWYAKRSLMSDGEVRELLVESARGLDLWEPYRRVEELGCPTGLSVRRQISFYELSVYLHDQLLRDTDQMSMAHALEVRVPLIGKEVVETVATLGETALTGVNSKALLRRIADKYFPQGHFERPKQGFTLNWEYLLQPKRYQPASPSGSLFHGEAVERAWRRFREGRTGFGPPFAVEVATTCGRTLGFR